MSYSDPTKCQIFYILCSEGSECENHDTMHFGGGQSSTEATKICTTKMSADEFSPCQWYGTEDHSKVNCPCPGPKPYPLGRHIPCQVCYINHQHHSNIAKVAPSVEQWQAKMVEAKHLIPPSRAQSLPGSTVGTPSIGQSRASTPATSSAMNQRAVLQTGNPDHAAAAPSALQIGGTPQVAASMSQLNHPVGQKHGDSSIRNAPPSRVNAGAAISHPSARVSGSGDSYAPSSQVSAVREDLKRGRPESSDSYAPPSQFSGSGGFPRPASPGGGNVQRPPSSRGKAPPKKSKLGESE